MWVDTLIQMRAELQAKQEEEKKKNEALRETLKMHPIRSLVKANNESFKLRTSKWFDQEEISVVCSVFESGFIVEKRSTARRDLMHVYGIALWEKEYEKSKNPKYLNIYTLVEEKMQRFKLEDFWTPRTQIKISNSGDRFLPINDVEEIRFQIKKAEKMKFDRDERFVVFCRYKKPRRSVTCWRLSNFFARIRALSGNW